MPDDTPDDRDPPAISVEVEVSNKDEFLEALDELADAIRVVRNEVQALDEELERLNCSDADSAHYAIADSSTGVLPDVIIGESDVSIAFEDEDSAFEDGPG